MTFSTIEEANEALKVDHFLHEVEIEVKRAMPNRFSGAPNRPDVSNFAQVEPQWDYAMYQAQPYAYTPAPMFIQTYPPPLIPAGKFQYR